MVNKLSAMVAPLSLLCKRIREQYVLQKSMGYKRRRTRKNCPFCKLRTTGYTLSVLVVLYFSDIGSNAKVFYTVHSFLLHALRTSAYCGVTTSVENINEEIISIRQCTDLHPKAKQIYDLMHYKYVAFIRKNP